MNLVIKNLNVSYDKKIIDAFDLNVDNGEFCTLVGHSGTGKSTILKSVAGLIDITADEISLDGEDILNQPTHKRNIGFVFQNPLLFPHLNVYDNIAYSLKIRKWDKKDTNKRVKELIELLELHDLENRMPNELSGGQQQRVSIGRAMAYHPKILLMDEPFSSLDPILRVTMGDFLKSLQKQLSLTIVFVTHDPLEALRLSDRIAFVHNGELCQYDEPEIVYTKPKMKIVGEFFGKSNYIKTDEGLLFIRPHQIRMSNNGEWRVISAKSTGKTCLYEIQKENSILITESMENDFVVGERVSIEMLNHHYLE